ncbi:MAG: hypothetical protein H8E13_11115 [Actinobacteria bacterium]|nr:hypothetical protein [Actinomycetota bacterium]
MEVIQSKNNVSIRLTEERWLHITEEHSDKEIDKKDGFIITAFLTRKKKQFERRIKL